MSINNKESNFEGFSKFSYNLLPDDPRFTIFGRTGSGKTVGMYEIGKRYSNRYKVLIYTPKPDKLISTIPLLTLEDWGKPCFFRRIAPVVNIRGEEIQDPKIILEYLSQLTWIFPYSIMMFDEASMVLTKSKELYSSYPYFARLYFQGREAHKGVILASQDPVNLHNDTMRQNSFTMVYEMNKINNQNAHKYFGYYIDFNKLKENPYSFWAFDQKANKEYYFDKIPYKPPKTLEE